MRKPLVALVVLFVLALIAIPIWLVLGSGTNSATESDDTAAVDSAPDEVDESTDAETSRVKARARSGDAALAGRITLGESGAAAHIEVRKIAERDKWNGVTQAAFALGDPWLGDAPIAETRSAADGSYSVRELPAGRYVVLAWTAAGNAGIERIDRETDTDISNTDIALLAGENTLRGKVVRASGDPVQAWIGFWDQGLAQSHFESRQAWVRTDDAGRFAIAGLGETTRLNAVDVAVASVQSGPVELPRVEPLVLTLPGGHLWNGRVVDSVTDEPLAGASVLGSQHDSETRTSANAATTTDEEGRFGLDLGPGEATFGAALATYVFDRSTKFDSPDEEVVIRLVPGGIVTGRVTRADDQTPVAGAIVRVGNKSRNFRGSGALRATTDADGTYTIHTVPPGLIRVYVLGGGWVSPELAAVDDDGYDPFAKQIEAAQTITIDLTVEPAATLSGVVQDLDGEPIADADVRARARVGGSTASSAADGSFELEDLIPEHIYEVRAHADGYVSMEIEDVRASADTEALTFSLQPSCIAQVTVLDRESGEPVKGARISIHQEGGRRSATSDEEGAATVDGLRPGKGRVSVASEQHLTFNAEDEIDLAPGEESTAETTVELDRGLQITGIVVDDAGDPVAGARVNANTSHMSRRGGRREYIRRNATAQEDGTFTVGGLTEGTYSVRASGRVSDQWAHANLEVAAGGEPIEIRIEFTAGQAAEFVVRAIGHDGTKVHGAEARYTHRKGGGSSSSSTTFRNGETSFTRDPGDGTHTVEISRPTDESGAALPYAPAELDISHRTDQEIEIVLPPELEITGRVVRENGDPVAGVRVLATVALSDDADVHMRHVRRSMRSNRGVPDAMTDEDGAFRVGQLAAGDMELDFATPPDTVKPDPLRVAAGTTGIEVVLGEATAVTITLMTEDDEPVSGVNVRIRTSGDDDRRDVTRVESDSDGRAVLHGLDAGRAYDLDIDEKGELFGVNEPAWVPQDQVFVLEPSYSVSGRVVDADGNGLPGVSIMREIRENSWSGSSTRQNGAFTFGSLRKDEVVRIRANHNSRDVLILTDTPTEVEARAGENDVVLQLPSLEEMVITVETDAPLPHSLAYWLELENSTQSGGLTPVDGRVRIAGLPADASGTLRLGPTPEGMYAMIDDLRAGARELTVRLEPGLETRVTVEIPPGAENDRVQVYAAGIHATEESAGNYIFPGLPPGKHRVNAWSWGDAGQWQGNAEVEAGGSITIEMRKRE